MKADISIDHLNSFRELKSVVEANIGYFPNFHFERLGQTQHRFRVYSGNRPAELFYNARAVARYVMLLDTIVPGFRSKSHSTVFAGLCLARGNELLLTNRFVGLGFISRAHEQLPILQLSFDESIASTIKKAEENSIWAQINLLLPLAHEIGHLPQAQKLAPSAIFEDQISETYALNYDLVKSFTGEFDYESRSKESQSPLHLQLLQEEIASDWFAVAAMVHMVCRTTGEGGVFPLQDVVTAVLSFPVVMAADYLAIGSVATKECVQDAILAFSCRYSVMIDSLRSCLASIFGRSRPDAQTEVNEKIDQMVQIFDDLHHLTWNAYMDFHQLSIELVGATSNEILHKVGQAAADANVGVRIALHLDALTEEAEHYSVDGTNVEKLRQYSVVLRTFDSVIIDGDGAVSASRKA